MSVRESPLGRCSVEDAEESLRVVISSRRHWFATLWLSCWILFWAWNAICFTGFFLIGLVGWITREPVLVPRFGYIMPPESNAILLPLFIILVILCVWIAGGVTAISALLWELFGTETVEFSQQAITVHLQTFRFGLPRDYLADHISGLRLPLAEDSPKSRIFRTWQLLPQKTTLKYTAAFERLMRKWSAQFLPQWRRRIDGALAFDFGNKTVRFGHGIGETEAEQILALVGERFPQYTDTLNRNLDIH